MALLLGQASSLRLLGAPLRARSQRGHHSRVMCTAESRSVDVIVVGGGHAGCEAAAAAARAGAHTLLVTQRVDTIGELSCNPSIGGIGKGHLVREVDALDGLMGKVIDEAGIHFRILNRRKGPAVQGPRAQADRDLYRAAMLSAVRAVDHLEIYEGSVEELLLEMQANDKWSVRGVLMASGEELQAGRVVITAGTFLRGVVHIGRKSRPAGRYMRETGAVEPPCSALAASLSSLCLRMARLKTGTPPRLLRSTIDFSQLESQPSDDPPLPLSFMNEGSDVAQASRLITCYKTYTNPETHRIVRENSHLLPEYESGEGKGSGPRYCPSLSSKVERFPDRDGHMVWLEPEGISLDTVYPNGISSAFPEQVQATGAIPSRPSPPPALPNAYHVTPHHVMPSSPTSSSPPQTEIIRSIGYLLLTFSRLTTYR